MRIGGIDGFPLILDLAGAQYSRIRLTTEGVGTLHFDQCEVWTDIDGKWLNVAAGKKTEQSSIWKPEHGPKAGNNGAITGEAGPHTHQEPNASWELNFEKMTTCNYLVLFNRLRFFSERMKDLQVFGHSKSGWQLLFSQSSAADVSAWGDTVLDNIDARLAAQIRASIAPQTSLASKEDKERAARSARFYQHLERLKSLRKLVASARLINANAATDPADDTTTASNPDAALKDAVRAGLQAALPMDLTPAPSDAFLFDVSGFANIHIRTRATHPKQLPPSESAFDLHFYDNGKTSTDTPPADSVHSDPAQMFDYISCRMSSTFVVPVLESGLSMSVNSGEIANVKWEVWGEDADGNLSLIYDNAAASRAIFQMQYLLERDVHPFGDLALGTRALELEGKYGAAWMFSLYYPTTAPETPEIADYLDKVEYLSFMDQSRQSVSRTKHGYRQTFRFKNKPAFAAGIQVVAETIAKGGYHGIPFYGTLLGFLRDGTLIDHDDDGDLLMLNPATSKEEMMAYREELLVWLDDNTDWTVYPGHGLPGKNMAVAFEHDGEWIHCDLFPTWTEGNDRMVLHEGRGGFVPLPAELFDDNRDLTIEGCDFKIPEKSEDLMELVYGDWRTPYRGYMLGFRYQVEAKQMAAAESPTKTDRNAGQN